MQRLQTLELTGKPQSFISALFRRAVIEAAAAKEEDKEAAITAMTQIRKHLQP